MATETKTVQPLTPPFNPYSPQEIAAFQKLDLALRSHPELAREGATLLNPKALARLVQGIKFFQDTHLGLHPTSKYHKSKKWPLMKLPDEFFRLRTGDGPLFHLFVSAYMYKKEATWRQFDFQSKNRYNDNIALLKKIQKDLVAGGHLRRPVVYFDDSVPKDTLGEYKSILKRFGGRIVKDACGTGENAPTHIVALDLEEHDTQENLDQEAAVGDLVEKLYLRTLAVVDPTKAKKSSGIIETTMQDSKKKGGKVKHGKGAAPIVFEHPMAFVHWWYHPSSYDEWMPAVDVAGADTDIPPKPAGGPWIVGCKFIRDVALFNEWGWEADYAVSDYAKKAKCWPALEEKLANEMKAVEAANKPTTLKIRLSLSSKNGKGKKSEKEEQKAVEAAAPVKRKRTPEHLGMQAKQIFTGFYSDSNKKLKKVVFNGMLRVPPFTTELVKDAIKNVLNHGDTGLDSKFVLPGIHDMIRPSLDPALASAFLVTSLRAGNAGTTRVTSGPLASIVGAERIRGGGGEGDTPMEDVSQPVPQQQQPALPQQTPTAPQAMPLSALNPVQQQEEQAQNPAVLQPTPVLNPAQQQKQQVQQPIVPQPMEVSAMQNPAVLQPTQVLNPAQQQKQQVQQPIVPQPTEVSAMKPVQSVVAPASNIAPVAKSVAPPPQAPIKHAPALPQAPASQTPLYTMPKTPILPVETASVNAPQLLAPQPITNVNTKSVVPAPTPVPSTEVKKPVVTNNEAIIKSLPPTIEVVKETQHLSGEQEQTTKLPSWYNEKATSDVEKSLLPEWFNNSADHRTESSYIVARGRILDVARRSSNKYLTSTAVRRRVVGDAGSIMRLHQFLVTWGFVNGSAIGDNAPLQVTSEAPSSTGENWSLQMSNMLGVAVTNFSKKRKLEGDMIERLEIDWDGVAEEVGGGVSPSECYEKFLSANFSDKGKGGGGRHKVKVVDLSPCKEYATREDLIDDIIDGVKPSVAKAVVDAALAATDADANTAQKAAVLGAISSKAVERARKEEASTSRILQEILDLRMARLENRLSLLDDLEGMLDAERMALELERRDLYTNRCRFWFNSDSA